MHSSNDLTFKVAVIGTEPREGKTAFIRRHVHGDFSAKYTPTIGAEVHVLLFKCAFGDGREGVITFNLWDCGSNPDYIGLREGYWIQSNAAFVFQTKKSNKAAVEALVDEFKVLTSAPAHVIFNKVDIAGRPKDVASNADGSTQVSVKTNYNFERPFLSLARKLTGCPDLVFIGALSGEVVDLD